MARLGAALYPEYPQMGDLVPYRSPHAKDNATAYVGMVVFIGAWAMMFAALFFAYGAMRSGVESWPPMGQPSLAIHLPALNTGVMIASSLALEAGVRAIRRGKVGILAASLAITTLLGIAFLAIQWTVGTDLFAQGLKPNSGPYGSVLYGLAGVHALHVVVGVLPLIWLTVRATQGKYSAPQHLPVRLWSLYWHFVGLIWLLMFVFVFAI